MQAYKQYLIQNMQVWFLLNISMPAFNGSFATIMKLKGKENVFMETNF
jgi:hypothetical protein